MVRVGGFYLPHTHRRARSSGSSSGGAQPHGGGTLGWTSTSWALPGRKIPKILGPVESVLPGRQGGCRRALGTFGILDRDIWDSGSARDARGAGGLGHTGVTGNAAPHTHLSEGGAAGVKLTNPSRTQRAVPLPKAPWGTSVAPVKMRML